MGTKQRIDNVCSSLELTRSELALIFGVNVATIYRWCNDKGVPDTNSSMLLSVLEQIIERNNVQFKQMLHATLEMDSRINLLYLIVDTWKKGEKL